MGAAGRAQSQPPALGSRTPRHQPLQVPLLITPIRGASGTHCSLAIGAVSVSWVCAWRPGPRRGSLGDALLSSPPPPSPARCAASRLLGGPWAPRPAARSAGGRCAPPLQPATPALALCSFFAHPHVDMEMGALGILSHSGQPWHSLAPPGSASSFLLSDPLRSYQPQIFFSPPLILESSQKIAPNLCFLSEGARPEYKNPDTN